MSISEKVYIFRITIYVKARTKKKHNFAANEFCVLYRKRNIFSCGICIIYFISINPFICIIFKDLQTIAIPRYATDLNYEKFLHHLAFHSSFHHRKNKREGKKIAFKMFNFLFKQNRQQWKSRSNATFYLAL